MRRGLLRSKRTVSGGCFTTRWAQSERNGKLCRYMCRNHAIHAGISRCSAVSFGIGFVSRIAHDTRMNTGDQCHSRFLGITRAFFDPRIRRSTLPTFHSGVIVAFVIELESARGPSRESAELWIPSHPLKARSPRPSIPRSSRG
jgi:hypothetical protein